VSPIVEKCALAAQIVSGVHPLNDRKSNARHFARRLLIHLLKVEFGMGVIEIGDAIGLERQVVSEAFEQVSRYFDDVDDEQIDIFGRMCRELIWAAKTIARHPPPACWSDLYDRKRGRA
jgi:hypothetical protein